MNTSENFKNTSKYLAVQTVYVDNGPEFRREAVEEILRHAAPLAPRLTRAKSAMPTARGEASSMLEDSKYKGLPPPTLPVTSGNHDPKSIRFIDGPDTALRRTVLRRRMHEVSADGAYQLLVGSEKGQVSVRLDRAVVAATAKSTAKARAVVGIDGVDQFLASPGKIACSIKSLTNINVAVICSIDSRYCDWLLLAFHLRILGLKVVSEKLAASVYIDGALMKQHVESKMALGPFPVTSTPALAAFTYRRRQLDGHIEAVRRYLLKAPAKTQMSSPQAAARNAAWQAAVRRDRDDCARAFRNSFAIGQLLREQGIH